MALIVGPIDIPTPNPVLRYSVYREEHAFNYGNSIFQGDEENVSPTDIYCYKIHLVNLTPNILTDIFARVRVRVQHNTAIGGGYPYTSHLNLNFIEPWPGGTIAGPIASDPGSMNCDIIRFKNLWPHAETTPLGHDQTVASLAFRTQSMHEGSKFSIELVFHWTPVIQQTCLIMQEPAEAPPQEIHEITQGD